MCEQSGVTVPFQALTAALITNLVRFTGLPQGESAFCLA